MTTAERLATIETMLAEVHGAVVGDGSKNSSLRERVAGLEAGNDWKHRLIAAGIPTVVSVLLSSLGVHVPAGTHS